MGIPCSHMIEEAILTRGYLVLTDFHQHWHLATIREHDASSSKDTVSDQVPRPEVIEELHSMYASLAPQQQALMQERIRELVALQQGSVNDPAVAITRGRPRASNSRVAASSTRRDPSGFELAEGGRRRRVYTCGLCGRPGHNRNGCRRTGQDNDEEEEDTEGADDD